MKKLCTLGLALLLSSCAATPSYAAAFVGKGELIGTSCDIVEHKRNIGQLPEPTITNCYVVVDLEPEPKAFAVDKDYSELVGTEVAVIVKDDGKTTIVGKGK
ncbi:hypothetical protein D3C87_954570 [compost metagenome]